MPSRTTLSTLVICALLVLPAQGLFATPASATLPWPYLDIPPAKSLGEGAKYVAHIVTIESYPFLEKKPVGGAKQNINEWQLYLTRAHSVHVENIAVAQQDLRNFYCRRAAE
jgi:hypothetical protein